MRMFAANEHRRICADAIGPRVGDRGVARGKQRREGRLGTAARERSTRSGRESSELAHPRYDAMLDDGRHWRHLPYGDALIERGRDTLGPDCSRQWARHLMPSVARMVEMIRIRDDLGSDAFN